MRRFLRQRVGSLSRYLPIDNEGQLVAFLQRPEIADTIVLSDARFRELCPHYDRLQLHDYQGWDTLDEVFAWIREQMRSNGCEKPIEFWEAGYGIDPRNAFDPNEQAQAVAKILAISAANEVRALIWFPLVDRRGIGVGLIDESGEVKPAATAYRTATSVLTMIESSRKLELGRGVEGYAFERSGRGPALALWANEPQVVRLPLASPSVSSSSSTVRVLRIDGSSEVVGGTTLQIDRSPVFVDAA